jgi:sugar phosphate isomerase/epimerase
MNDKRELAIVISGDNKVTGFESIKTIKEAGFRNVFIQWYKENSNDNQKQLEYIKELGLNVIFAHLDYLDINSIWEEGEKGDSLVEDYKADIKVCKENGISLVVMHLTISTHAPAFNNLGLERIRKITNYANEIGMKIAFENTRLKGYLEYIMTNITDENVGVCYDSGHDHAHFNDDFDFEFFKNRIFAVHLHDNHGLNDEHLIPFDGTIDWDRTISGLKKGGYMGSVTLECVYDNGYLKLSPTAFFKKAYEAGQKLAEKFNS